MKKLTLSGIISPKMTYGIGEIPMEAMKRVAEKLTTGTH